MPLHRNIVYINYAHSKSWGNEISQVWRIIPVNRDLSDRSFTALATYYFGHHHQIQAFVDQGLRQYGSALKELNAALANDKKRDSFDALDAVLAMIMLEVRPKMEPAEL